MTRRRMLGLLLLVMGVLVSQARPSKAAARPNVLFIAVDDLRPELACFGKTHIKSPHIDRLAGRGTAFTRAYCQQAVCSPSRTSLMTGLRPDTTRVYDLETHFRNTIPDAVTLAQHFKANGYWTTGMGKIYHNGKDDPASWSEPHRERVGGDLWVLPENKKVIREKAAAARAMGLKAAEVSRVSRGSATEMADVPDEAYTDGALAKYALETLARLKEKGQPFFLAVGFQRPHLPFNAPKRYWDLYDRSKIGLADNPFPAKGAPRIAGTNWGELRQYAGIPKTGDLSEDQARELRHGYYANISFTDANVGKLLNELDRQGLSENTIVVLWGDHGWKLGEHAAWCKHTNYELDANAPLIVAAPGAKSHGKRSRALVEFVDIYPTLCDLTGLPHPQRLEGTSFAPLLNQPDRAWKRAAFSQYPRGSIMGYSMKTDGHRLTLWVDRKNSDAVVATELYDHVKDPHENENVADRPEYAEVLKRLTEWHRAGWKGAAP
jgi:iduronate 2-sulfatase